MSHILELENVTCAYGESAVVKDLCLRIREGCFTCLLGPSGCGKSTILRAIAGLEPVQSGQITMDGKLVSSTQKMMPPEKRQLGMVFQDYALFPHMSVTENICFGIRKLDSQKQRRISSELLELVGLEPYAKRYPHELSGGQQQRVALARALATEPRIILLDEPFSNLDVELRERLSLEVREILKTREITGVLVTHDQAEAFAVSDMVAVLRDGELQQWDTSYNLYHDPCNRFVANFIGQGVFLPGELINPNCVKTEIGEIRGDRAYDWPIGTRVDVLIRPDDIKPKKDSLLRTSIIERSFKGSEILYTLKLTSGHQLLSAFPSHCDLQIGEQVGIELDLHHLIAFKQ
ncbi:MAG: ABC transporter ATP-binding protein [Gammaproteobacteria bacterium]|nr:ABC transporter ATP-binding protein [Gammaproteobacteria bacterium]